MTAFEFIRTRLADEDSRYPGEAASTLVGTALCRVVTHEASLEDKRRRNRESARTDEDLLKAAIIYLDQNWVAEMARAKELVEARSANLLEDRLSKALDFAWRDADAEKHPVWFAIWTGVVANTVWLLLGALVLLLALIWTGNSLEDAVKNLLS